MTRQKLDEKSIRRLIEATIASCGDVDPTTLPHVLRRRLEGQVSGDLDLDRHIREVLRSTRR